LRNVSKYQIIFNHPLIDEKRCIGKLIEIYQAQPGSGQNSRIELKCRRYGNRRYGNCEVKYFINTELSGSLQELFDRNDPKVYDSKNYGSVEIHGTHKCHHIKRFKKRTGRQKYYHRKYKIMESPETVPETNCKIIESPETAAELLHVFKKQKRGPPYYHFKIGEKKYSYKFVGIQLRDILHKLRF
jgi:hypothetical protein